MADPVYANMLRGNKLWGNLMYNNNTKHSKFFTNNTRKNKHHPSPHKAKPNNTNKKIEANNNANNIKQDIEEILEDYVPPDLKLRKHIWENFPVALTKLDDKDGVDRYGVAWHVKNLMEWRKTRPKSWDEYNDYEIWNYIRLKYALKKHPKQYKILRARNPSQLFVIEMVFKK
jgi:hypothetical protein